MPVSGNQETAIGSLGSQSCSDGAGVPMKKRRFIWPSSPTPEEQPLSQAENVALEKQNLNPSQESKPAVTSPGLFDTNKSFSMEENKKGSFYTVPTNSCINNSSFKIQEASLAIQLDSLAKSGDDEKLVVTQKSADIPAGIKPLGGVPMKKRRFVCPPSLTNENPSFVLDGNNSMKKEYDRLSLDTSPSSTGKSSGLSDLPEKNKISVNMVQTSGAVYRSRVKIEEASPTVLSDSLAKFDNKKLLRPAKSADTELNVAPNKTVELNVGNEQISGRKPSMKSVGSGNHELSLGLTGSQPSAVVDQSHDNSWKQGNIESFSLNLSLAYGEKISQHIVDQVQSDSGICNVFSDRSNWDLNTTMDAWEASVNDGDSGQVVPHSSNVLETRIDAKPLMSMKERRTSSPRTSSQTGGQYNSEDSLHLCLSPSFTWFNRQEISNLSANRDSLIAVPNISLPKELLLGSQTVNSKTVKSEPIEESVKNDSSASKSKSMSSLDFRVVPVKSECVEKLAQEVFKSLNSSPGQSLKSEPLHGDNLVTMKMTVGTSQQSDKEVLQNHDAVGQSSFSMSEHVPQGLDHKGQSMYSMNESVLQVQDTTGTGQSNSSTNEHVLQGQASGGKSNCSMDELQGLSLHAGLAEGAHFSNEAIKELCESAEKSASEIRALPITHSGDEINGSGAIDPIITEEKSANILDRLKLKSKDELPPVPHQTVECTVSDEEKIILSGDMLEEDSYGSDFESNGNSVPMDIEEEEEEEDRGHDDYEDGEVREPQPDVAVKGPVWEKTEDACRGDSIFKNAKSEDLQDDLHPSSSSVEGKDTLKEQPVAAKKDAIVDVDTTLDRKTSDAQKDASLEGSSTVEISSDTADGRKVLKTIRRNMIDFSAKKDEILGTAQSSDQPAMGQGTLVGTAEGMTGNFKMNNVEKDDSVLQNVETYVNADDAAKDANSGGSQSRIINLSTASNTSSFGKARIISGKPFSLRSGRERLPDMPLEGERLHLRGREEPYTEASHKFSREWYQDQSSRNSRWNFFHGRGRIGRRIDSLRNDRDFEQDCVSRYKYTAGVTGSDNEYMNYNIGPDGAFDINNVRGESKLMDDETPLFRQFSSRRRSPGARDGPVSCGLQMVRRGPRSNGEDTSEVVGLRHAEKMMRGFPDDSEEHAYAHPQLPYKGLDARFVQGTRNFPTAHRRGMPQMRSKSPIISRSPGPWSSRRRSPDGFGGPPEVHHRRSPVYRMERIRSPNSPGYPTDRVPRRHASPSYMTRPSELSEMDPGRDHGHPRSIISNRTPNGRVLLRSNRRFNIVDPLERAENEEFFGGPGRFHELGGDRNGEERRRFDARRAHVRPFRPSFNGSDGENFHLSTEDGPRSFRYFPEDNQVFHERVRDYDNRQIKNRLGNGLRRPRSIEEPEGNYRNAGQLMNDDGFDDMSRVKRKRF